MNYWLMKSEPDSFSFDDLKRNKKTIWDGVRNYQARNHMRDMKKNDEILFYHSNMSKEIVGIAKVSKEFFPDTSADSGDWSAVEVKPIKDFKSFVHLKEIKNNPKLKDMTLVKQPRLSVMPVEKKHFEYILKLGGL